MPTPEILTQRLILNALRREDAAAVFAYRADPEVQRHQSWAPASVEEVAPFLIGDAPTQPGTPGTWFQFGIRLRASGALIGDLGVHTDADDSRQAELGITIAPWEQRRGLGSEALAGMITWLFTTRNLHRIHASVDPRNTGSVAMLRRVGLRQEAHFHRSLWFKGEWADDLVFAVLASEWTARFSGMESLSGIHA